MDMSSNPDFCTLILATSYASEFQNPELCKHEYPRTDYVELSRHLNVDIIDYSVYDNRKYLSGYRKFEKKLRLDFHMAFAGIRKARNYDVVMLMSERVAIPYMMLQKIVNRKAATVYVSAHSSEKQAKISRKLKLLQNVDIAVSNTHAQKNFLINQMLIPQERIRYVLYAVDEKFYVPPDGISSENYIFSAGGIAGRDYPTLFESVKKLPVQVKVAAGGRFYGPDAQKELPKIPKNVEMLAQMNSFEMRKLYQGASMIIVPLNGQRQDAAGCSVVLEGMCCGKPVIATYTKGMEDYVHDRESGVLVEPNSSKAMKSAIMKVMEDKDFAIKIAKNARAECEVRLYLNSLVQGLKNAAIDAYKR